MPLLSFQRSRRFDLPWECATLLLLGQQSSRSPFRPNACVFTAVMCLEVRVSSQGQETAASLVLISPIIRGAQRSDPGLPCVPNLGSGSEHTKMDQGHCAVSPVPVLRPEMRWAGGSGPCLGWASCSSSASWPPEPPAPRHTASGQRAPFFHVSSGGLPVLELSGHDRPQA